MAAVSDFSGFLLVAQHDQILFAKGYGYANEATRHPPTADTSFRIGSVTKQFTAAAILQLEQAGKLSVDAKVSAYLPDYPGPGKDVTLAQLLSHTAGIPSYTENAQLWDKRGAKISVRGLLETFWMQPLEFPPGTKHQYSNSGYIILGAIIERVSGMSYADYLRTHLFVPAGLAHTEVGDAVGAADRAEGYELAHHAHVAAHAIDMSFPFAAGAVRSTANDLVKWHRALSGDTILNAVEREKLYKPWLDRYAFGWMTDEVEGHPVVMHNGGIDGFQTSYWRSLDADVVVVAWTNVEGVDIDGIAKNAVAATFGGKLTPQVKEQPVPLDRALVDRFAGTFALDDASKAVLMKMGAPPKFIEDVATMTVSASRDGIAVKPAGQPTFELLPSAGGTFYDSDHHIRIRPGSEPTGAIKSFTLEQGKLQLTYTRS